MSQDHYNFFTRYFDKKKCIIIENFVDYSSFDNLIKDKTDECLYIGRLSKEKGFFDLLEACNLLKKEKIKFKLNVVGVAPNNRIEQEIDLYVKKHHLDNIVNFYGLKQNEEKFKLFRLSKILVFPSHFENSPVVLKEGIAAKMAIIASDISANINILTNKENNILHRKNNPVDLSEKLKALILNTDKANELCEASSQIKIYDTTYAKEKLQSLLNEIC